MAESVGAHGASPWYTRPGVTIAALYVFLPAGLYHMWCYRGWPLWIQEGGRVGVWVMFEVDEDARPAELKYTPSYGFKQRVKFTFE